MQSRTPTHTCAIAFNLGRIILGLAMPSESWLRMKGRKEGENAGFFCLNMFKYLNPLGGMKCSVEITIRL